MKEQIINLVSNHFNVPVEKITGPTRKVEVCRARSVAAFLLYKWAGMGSREIAIEFKRVLTSGDADRSAALHWCKKAEEALKAKQSLYRDIIYLDAICEDLAA
jgi:chromosomal replication initiation ATPase DnaA